MTSTNPPFWRCPLCGTTGEDPAVVFCPVDGAQVHLAAPEESPWVGRIIQDRYRVLRFLGAGGMAEVFEVERLDSGKRLALKRLKADLSGKADQSERFRQEAMLVSLIAHRNVVAIEDYGTCDDQTSFMVMELLSGRTLAQALAAGDLPLPVRLDLLLQACEGMAAAHERGVVHRDLKPENLFLADGEPGQDPVLKILDLGLGKLFTGSSVDKGLTVAGTVFGTPAYMSPEQCLGEPAGKASDIYSMSVILYEVVFGQLPFDDESYVKVLLQHASSPPPWDDAQAAALGLPATAKAVILKGLSKDPEQRQESMLELQRDIAGLRNRSRHRSERWPPGPAGRRGPPEPMTPPGSRVLTLPESIGDDDEIVELAADVFWVGRRHGARLECNTYLRRFANQGTEISVLIDPGPPRDMQAVVAKVTRVLGSFERLSYIFLNHQDPDVCGSAAALQQLTAGAFVICSEDTWRLARFYGLDPRRFISTESLPGGHLGFSTGHRLAFVPTPFCHFRGAVMVYDPETGVLFSGDLCGGTSTSPELMATEASFKGVQLFHEIYMPSGRAVARAIQAIRNLEPAVRVIAPQHGAVIADDQVAPHLARIAALKLGMDLIEANEHDPQALQLVNEILREHRRVAGGSRSRELLARYGADRSISSIFELREPGEVVAFRVDPRLAIDTLLGDILRTAPPEVEQELFTALTPLHERLLATRPR